MESQHFATSADVERARSELIERMGQLEVRLVDRIEQSRTDLIERMGQLEVRMVERIERVRTELIERIEQVETRTLRWIAGLFAAQTFVLVAAVLGMIEVLR